MKKIRKISPEGRRLLTLSIIVSSFPIILVVSLPITWVIDLNYLISFLSIIFTSISCLVVINRCNEVNYDWNASNFCRINTDSTILKISFFSTFILFFNVVYATDFSLDLDLGTHRELFDSNSLKFALYISALINWTSYISLLDGLSLKHSRLRMIKYISPYILSSLMYLYVGNRQYVFYGIILIILKIITSNNFKKNIWKLLFILGLIFTILFGVQILRQKSTEGRQLDFILSISSMKCDSTICDSDLSIPMAYAYQYFAAPAYGMDIAYEYIKGADNFAPLFSQTIPILYQQYSNTLGLESREEVRERIHGYINDKFNVFPRFWVGMWAAIYYELGIFGEFIVIIILWGLSKIMIRKRWPLKIYYMKYAPLMIMASLIHGVLIPPLLEPYMFSYYCFILIISLTYRGYHEPK